MSQTVYTSIPANAFQGMLADDQTARDVISAAYHAGANGSAEFGSALTFVAAFDDEAQLPTDTNANQPFKGVAIQRFISPATATEHAETGEQGIADTQTVDLLTKGRIWVMTEGAVDPTKNVYYRYSANGANVTLGRWSGTTDAGHNQQLAAARWLVTTAAAGLALLELDVP